MLKRLSVLLFCFVMVLSLAACTKPAELTVQNEPVVAEEKEVVERVEEKDVSYYPITFTNYAFDGTKIEQTVEKEPEKVLAVYQSSLETMLALGLGDKIIATAGLDVPVKDEWKDEFEKIQYFENAPSKEAVIDMEPDMIISWYSYFMDKFMGEVYYWHDKGVNTYILLNSGVLRPNKLEYEYEDILTIGKIFNKNAEAEEIVSSMKAQIETAEKYVKDKEKVTATILEVGKENTFRNYGGDSVGGNIAELAGAILPIPLNGSFGVEELIEANPEVIFTVYYGDAILKDEAAKAILENPALASLDAVRNNRVHAIMLSEVYASGVRTADGINTIVEGLYPDINK